MSSILTEIILVFWGVHAGGAMNGYNSVLLSTTVVRGRGRAPEIPVSKSVRINE